MSKTICHHNVTVKKKNKKHDQNDTWQLRIHLSLYIIMFSLAGEFVQTSGPVLPPDCQPRHSLPGFGVSVALAPCGPHRGPVRLRWCRIYLSTHPSERRSCAIDLHQARRRRSGGVVTGGEGERSGGSGEGVRFCYRRENHRSGLARHH